ncbi:MAG: RNA polymerase sigma-70 factor [Flavobacteriaceae bacterium]|nr:RNA polymerase sigma-70 factor [Flavobacteriaceae bacterium]MCY4216440.1 RNA polymerase sigma-70 factor [Flavobacteriaceae bacterium]MCY4253884.1 RNA polymerase sigma-70 factor [Flavobacteriaceae bacterium]
MNNLKKEEIKSLVIELQKGNQKAFKSLFDIFHMKLYHYILQFVKSFQVAEDLTQEIFLKVWMKRSQLNDNKDFSSFLFVMTRNLVYDHLRKSKSKRGFIKKYFEFKERQLSYSTDDEVQLNEYERYLNKIIEKLPKQKQKIYIMSRKEGKNNQEIAQILGITPKSVKNSLWETLKIIKEQLKPIIYNN